MRILTVCALLVMVVGGAFAQEDWLGPRPVMSDRPVCGHALARYAGATLAESLHSYNVRHYRLDINLPMTDSSYTAHEGLAIRSDVPELDSFTLHFCNLVCDSVARGDIGLGYFATDTTLTVMLNTPLIGGDSTVIDIWYHRENVGPLRGYYFARSTLYPYCHTCTPPRDARYWMPCFDEPQDKAERGVDLNLTVPDSFQTCSNGLLDSVTSGPGTRTYWWRHPYSIATYLMTFSASRFSTWRQMLPNGTGDSIPSDYYIWQRDSAASRTAFWRVPDMMRYFSYSTMYGEYPFEKYGMTVGYYSFPWGGMENQTLVMINSQWLGGGSDNGIAHEMSHMWYGDMVTCVDFRNVWLNEGFATFSEANYMGHATGRANFNQMMRTQATQAMQQDRSHRFPIYDPSEADIYNYGTIYCKGSWVLRMLQFVEGDTAWQQPGVMFRAMRAYGDSFRYGTASTEDFERINEHETGLDLGWFFEDWVYGAGYPHYSLNWYQEPAGDSFRVITTLAQTNGAGAVACFRMPVPVRMNCEPADTLLVIRPLANPQTDTFMIALCPDSLTFDPDNWILDSAHVTGIAEPGQNPLHGPQVLGVSPNPTHGEVRFSLPPGAVRTLVVYDNCGRQVARLDARGRAQIDWTPTLPAGVYYVRALGTETGPLERLVLID